MRGLSRVQDDGSDMFAHQFNVLASNSKTGPTTFWASGASNLYKISVRQGEVVMTSKMLIADDSAIVRRGIREILSTQSEFEVVGEATNFNETDRLIKALNPDVVIMDIHMPGENTAISNEFISRLRCSKLLAISIWGDEPTRMRAEVLGAAILLDKANLRATLIPTVTELCQRPV